jgi:hypothetical protein
MEFEKKAAHIMKIKILSNSSLFKIAKAKTRFYSLRFDLQINKMFAFNLMESELKSNHNKRLEQWFSTGVPRHTIVPCNIFKCAAKS